MTTNSFVWQQTLQAELAFIERMVKTLQDYTPTSYDALYTALDDELQALHARLAHIPVLRRRLEDADPRNYGKSRCLEPYCGKYNCTTNHRSRYS
jgi:hypothetical protein